MKHTEAKKTVRLISLSLILGISTCLFTGCSEEITPDIHTLSVDFEGRSGAGIGVGSTYDEWALAYADYYVQEMTDDGLGPYYPEVPEEKKDARTSDESDAGDAEATGETSANDAGEVTGENSANDSGQAKGEVTDQENAEEPRHSGKYMISAFYLDDEPVSVEKLMADLDATPEELSDRLSDPTYLAGHDVLYRYVIFTIEDDVVTDVDGDYLDYNVEL